MIVKGRDKPIVGLHMDETGVLYIRVDFGLQPDLWVEIVIQNEDLEALQRGEALISDGAKTCSDQTPRSIGRAN